MRVALDTAFESWWGAANAARPMPEPTSPSQPPAEQLDPFAYLTPWPELHAWRHQLAALRPGDPVPPCPTPALDPDGRPYGTEYLERLASEDPVPGSEAAGAGRLGARP